MVMDTPSMDTPPDQHRSSFGERARVLQLSDLQLSAAPSGTGRVKLEPADVDPETHERRLSLINVLVSVNKGMMILVLRRLLFWDGCAASGQPDPPVAGEAALCSGLTGAVQTRGPS